MSIRVKVLLFATLAMGLASVLGLALFFGARQAQRIRARMMGVQEQLDAYEDIESSAWPYLDALSRARRSGEGTQAILEDMEARLETARARILECVRYEEQWPEFGSRGDERAELEQVHRAMRHWAEQAEARVRSAPEGVPLASSVVWEIFEDYEQEVDPLIDAVQRAEHEELLTMGQRWDASARTGMELAQALPTGGIAFMAVLALAILLPMQRSLRALREGAQRIGHGDFSVELPDTGLDELGLLGRAMNRMASELQDTLREKQRLVRAEAESSEREARRYSALLEETVRLRTAELAATNARLEESLEQLQHTQSQLLLADRLASLGRLAAGVGHEINNPLAFILGNLRYVHEELGREEDAPRAPERQEMLEALSEAMDGAERVRLIVQDLKTFSRPDDVVLGPVELEPVVRTAVKMAAHEVRARARLVHAGGDVPRVYGNAQRLGQVFLNLILNAAHAIAPGQPEANEIRVEARPGEAGLVTVEVRDTGCGIPEDVLPRIFEPFFTTKPVGEGTGLGLSVCHGIISSLGGKLDVESEPGRGTTFRMTLRQAEDGELDGNEGTPGAVA